MWPTYKIKNSNLGDALILCCRCINLKYPDEKLPLTKRLDAAYGHFYVCSDHDSKKYNSNEVSYCVVRRIVCDCFLSFRRVVASLCRLWRQHEIMKIVVLSRRKRKRRGGNYRFITPALRVKKTTDRDIFKRHNENIVLLNSGLLFRLVVISLRETDGDKTIIIVLRESKSTRR